VEVLEEFSVRFYWHARVLLLAYIKMTMVYIGFVAGWASLVCPIR